MSERPIEKIVLPGQTPEGQYILSVLVKRTYLIANGKPCVGAAADKKLIAADTPYGDPMNTTFEFESDFVPFKLATDVVVNGKAHAPGGKPIAQLTASVHVGDQRKEIRVVGDRVCHFRDQGDPVFADPQPFTTMDLRYERAYGGIDVWSQPKAPCAYPRNHLGKGFVVLRNKKAIDQLPLPNLEDPHNLLTPSRLITGSPGAWQKQPLPQGFGWYSKYWQPRASLAGILPADRPVEQELRRAYAEALPPEDRKEYVQAGLPDIDFRFFNGASPGMVFPFLTGEETIRLVHLTPDGDLTFRLPGDRPTISLDIGEGPKLPAVVLHTVMIRVEDRQVDLVWRGAVPYPGPDWLPRMRKMEVAIS